MITITAELTSGRQWPNGKPIHTELLSDGRTKHTLEGGRKLIVSEPTYLMDYQSNWVGAKSGDTYSVKIAISGLSAAAGFFEAWNFDISEVRNYAFSKTVRIKHLTTGDVFTGEELQTALQNNATEPCSRAEGQL